MTTSRGLECMVSAFGNPPVTNNGNADESVRNDERRFVPRTNDRNGHEAFVLDAETIKRQAKRRERSRSRRKIRLSGNEIFGLKSPVPRKKQSPSLDIIQEEIDEQNDEAYFSADENEFTTHSIADSDEIPVVCCATAVAFHVVRPVQIEITASTQQATLDSTTEHHDELQELALAGRELELKLSCSLGDSEEKEESDEERVEIFDAIEVPLTRVQLDQDEESDPLLVTLAPLRQNTRKTAGLFRALSWSNLRLRKKDKDNSSG